MDHTKAVHDHIEQILISEINILNSRSRNKKTQRELIANIQAIGLKRPITVSKRHSSSDEKKYDLICGQGRLEAFQTLKQTHIPAFIFDTSTEDCLVMSLVENIARRQHRPIDVMREVGKLRERGHSDKAIAELIGFTPNWVNMIGVLFDRGEEKLLSAVETGLIPVSMATDIARASETEIQNILTNAYEEGFRGKRLTALRHLLELRSKNDKMVRGNPLGGGHTHKKKLTAADLRRLFEQEAERQKVVVKRAAFIKERLVFVTEAMKELVSTPEFALILKAANLDSLPKLLIQRIESTGNRT